MLWLPDQPAGWSGSGNGGPALNALATVMLLMSFVVAGLGHVGYRIMTRGQRVAGQASRRWTPSPATTERAAAQPA